MSSAMVDPEALEAGHSSPAAPWRDAGHYVDQGVPHLIQHALARGEGELAANGALAVRTGSRTGRSPADRFIVDHPDVHDAIDWGKINQPMPPTAFEALWSRALAYVRRRRVFVAHLAAVDQPQHHLRLEVVTELAWHNLFARQLFLHPAADWPEAQERTWTVLCLPGLQVDPRRDGTNSESAVTLDLVGRRILVAGMYYAGEMKKAVFSALNFHMPARGVLPMHAATNVGERGDLALFFGLSGTGKTTLSADPDRFLIGDDEHGWDDQGVHNFEGGCYAKCIHLTREREPLIYDAIGFGAVMENVVLDSVDRRPLYDDASLTENTRVAYSRELIQRRMPGNRGGHPRAVIFLTCDLFGVLPPVARLTRQQAAYHFMSGYTALVGSTEVGSFGDIRPTFSACFGAPFFPRKAQVYADLLMGKVASHGTPVYLVNTGWVGGAYGDGGQRISIASTRAIIHAILRGDLEHTPLSHLPGLNLSVPVTAAGVDDTLLDPRARWADTQGYDRRARQLIALFQENAARLEMSPEVRAAGPAL